MYLKSVTCFRPTVYNGILVDLGLCILLEALAELCFSLDRLILTSLVFMFYIMRIIFLFAFRDEVFYKGYDKVSINRVYIISQWLQSIEYYYLF